MITISTSKFINFGIPNICLHVKLLACRLSIARLHVTNGRDGLQLWTVATSFEKPIVNSQQMFRSPVWGGGGLNAFVMCSPYNLLPL
jgi:hypothetical protein